MASINTIVKRKQYLWLGIVVVGTASAIGGALYLSDVDMSGNGETVAEQEPVPDMTGVVDTTFDDKVRQHATTEMQVTAAQMQKQYEEIRRELDVLNKQRGDDQRRIEKLGQDNAALAEQVKALGANPVTATGEPVPQMPASPPGPEGEPQPGNTPVSFPPQGSVAVPPPTAFYPGNGVTPPPQVTYQSVPVPIGHAMVASYEMIFTQPDSVTYSKTGMLFGANLIVKSTDFLSRNPEIINLFQDYVQNCVLGDIYLNHKYTLEDLMASADPYTLIFSRPSPLRGVYDNNNNFITCKDASVTLKDRLNLDTKTGGKTWHYYVQQIFGGRPDPDLLFRQLVSDSYSYFYGSSQSASQIMRQNVTMNALKEGITSNAARNGDTASLVSLATTSSMEKQRLAHVSIGHVTMRNLPMVQTILTGIAIGIFPLLILAAVFNKLTLSVLKGYVFALMWLQTWPLLYAILNSAMTFYAKQNGAPVVLSELSQIQLKYSNLASTAGYLSAMIPPLSWMMVKGLGAGFSSVYSHFASSSISPTASAAGSVVDGNYSYGNMQTENVNGFSWSTNSTTSFGQMMYQTGSGATATQTRDGNMVMDASGAMSRLPVGINATRQIAAAQQEMAREASNRAESALHGFSSSSRPCDDGADRWSGVVCREIIIPFLARRLFPDVLCLSSGCAGRSGAVTGVVSLAARG